MHDTTAPEAFIATLEHLGIADALQGYIAPERVRRWGCLEVEAFAQEHGYCFARENGNLYGKLMLVPVEATAAPAPVLRVVTRSDVAAVYPSRKVA